jgi:hypothetical protein
VDDRLFGVDDAKRCCTCQQIKPLSEFNKLRRAKDGRQYSCRDCNKAYHYANWDRHMVQIRSRVKDQRIVNQTFIVSYLRTHPCVDCGETDIVVLEFDHLRDKTAAISRLIGSSHSVGRILEEIAKCDVLCCNCHRRRTARRARNYRFRAVESDR